jgi:hypothetical protein
MERLGFGKFCPPLVMCGVELQVTAPLLQACGRLLFLLFLWTLLFWPLSAHHAGSFTHQLQLLGGSSANDLMSFGLSRSVAQELAAALDGITDIQKWLEIQVKLRHGFIATLTLALPYTPYMYPTYIYIYKYICIYIRCLLEAAY